MAAPINYNRKYFEDIFGTDPDKTGSLPDILKRITEHMQDKLKANVVAAQATSTQAVLDEDFKERKFSYQLVGMDGADSSSAATRASGVKNETPFMFQ